MAKRQVGNLIIDIYRHEKGEYQGIILYKDQPLYQFADCYCAGGTYVSQDQLFDLMVANILYCYGTQDSSMHPKNPQEYPSKEVSRKIRSAIRPFDYQNIIDRMTRL